MNNPFYYTPSEECLKAVRELTEWLYGRPSPFCDHTVCPAFREEVDKGKMFGVLVVSPPPATPSPKVSVAEGSDATNHVAEGSDATIHYLAGYSGQVCGRSDWQEFVPAVFDYLQPDGYFKQHEAEITQLNHNINALQGRVLCPPAMEKSGAGGHKALPCKTDDPKPIFDKKRRDGETDGEYIRRRQFENAELHRWKLRQRQREETLNSQLSTLNALKTLRRQKSDDLQRWLFRHFLMRNGKGESKDLLDIFQSDGAASPLPAGEGNGERPLPPAGSGECCEPKLLQYAFTHGLKPVSMAMFWWQPDSSVGVGEMRGEVRHHLHFYPACNGKCKPILKWMLQGIDVDPNPLESKEHDAELAARIKYIYEDDSICVISKPAGLLSVPGKTGRESVYDILRGFIVHRLDMDTSGLMVIAKTEAAYHDLQRQFANHEVKKMYVAVLERRGMIYHARQDNGHGVISLPLRPDLDDRPRQMVDFEYGKEAVTYYNFISDNVVQLFPQTGRTHQLRVHCAHPLGLNNPIKGDALYGTRADRLYLHAQKITFRHPDTGRLMSFTDKCNFLH